MDRATTPGSPFRPPVKRLLSPLKAAPRDWYRPELSAFCIGIVRRSRTMKLAVGRWTLSGQWDESECLDVRLERTPGGSWDCIASENASRTGCGAYERAFEADG